MRAVGEPGAEPVVAGGGGVVPRSRDRGSATVLVVGAIAALLVMTAGALTVASVVTASHRARLAADLAAIAAAMSLRETNDPGSACTRAAGIAAGNGGRVTACRTDGHAVTITVEVRASRWPSPAVARARAGPDGS
ncbi:MAG: flp pilus-assembly TadE/G-like family protein [Intrasporangium sp.]|uniref:Rv3654c family TadE-like protein n=1 Tax=Intrasporangium sp. TaxID=1925024 RepID=UPI002647F099|nr:Rv3654c family TadE-like protein [Intrasporangium sp.]MDN5795963.1 flp pilus-assembly TadE/G-like family protein [Intrasporangium sp.]